MTTENIEQQALKQFAEQAYLNYSMYVILDRALPQISDGLKPVQRRIIYAMSELGLRSTAKHKKSARTVGDVLGKYHPHGDSACYDAMVLMAQDFSYRYPLVDGQGNWGSSDDPKSFAAMRYTESRLSSYAQSLLEELEQGTVDWVDNFDGSLEEPSVLPARLPNILLNGTTGIAVGMATDIPPHNATEVAAACVHLIDHPEATVADLCKIISAPDFPTEAEIITSSEDLQALYKNGNGSLRARATYIQEEGDIIITALPYQTSGAKILEQIAAQMQAKKLPMIDDLRDESDHENPTRLVITPRSNRIDVESVMAHLFATTDLERSYRVNLNMIGLDGKPQVKNLRQILTEWLAFRQNTVRRRLQYRLDKVEARLHILAGLLIAYLNIDEIIAIIRNEEHPKSALILKFNLSELQAEAILELKLRHLARLEEIQIRTEQDSLAQERTHLSAILGSATRLNALIREELIADSNKYGDQRRSPLIARSEAKALSEEAILPSEAITVVLSEKGWVRAAKSHEVAGENLSYRAGDQFLQQAQGRSNQAAIFFDSTGRSYSLAAHSLPSARGQGEPLSSRLKPEPNANFIGVLLGEPQQNCLLVSNTGYGFVTTLGELVSKNRSGKAILKLSSDAKMLPAKLIADYDHQYVAAISNEGRLLLCLLRELPQMPRGKGNRLMLLSNAQGKSPEYLRYVVVLSPGDRLVLHASKRKLTLKFTDLQRYQAERGKRGQKLPKGFERLEQITLETGR